MKFEDINKRYTELVQEVLAKGYWVNAGTMGGSQGEIAHIDLTDGKQIIRVLLDSGYDHWDKNDQSYDCDCVKLIVGLVPATERVEAGKSKELGNIVWNNHLEVLVEAKFYKMDRYGDWYLESEEGQSAIEKRSQRRREKYAAKNAACVKVLNNARAIVLPFIKRQPGCKTVSKSEPIKVFKSINRENRYEYFVEVRGHQFALG